MKLLHVVFIALFGSLFLGQAQAAALQDYVCSFKPERKVLRGLNPIPEFVVISVDPKDGRKVSITDEISLRFGGAASVGGVVSKSSTAIKFGWSVRVTTVSRNKLRVHYTLRMRLSDGKATLTVAGPDVVGGLFGRGKCVVKAAANGRARPASIIPATP